MKRFKFVMESGVDFDCIAYDFRKACMTFEQAGMDPSQILAIEER